MRHLAQASDVQLHIGESILAIRGYGFRAHRFAMPRNDDLLWETMTAGFMLLKTMLRGGLAA
jgi:hypothetical protein